MILQRGKGPRNRILYFKARFVFLLLGLVMIEKKTLMSFFQNTSRPIENNEKKLLKLIHVFSFEVKIGFVTLSRATRELLSYWSLL